MRRFATRSSTCSRVTASGLLHEIARTLHQLDLNIAVSKVNTEGQSVADVFYIADENGNKVQRSTTIA